MTDVKVLIITILWYCIVYKINYHVIIGNQHNFTILLVPWPSPWIKGKKQHHPSVCRFACMQYMSPTISHSQEHAIHVANNLSLSGTCNTCRQQSLTPRNVKSLIAETWNMNWCEKKLTNTKPSNIKYTTPIILVNIDLV